jgi:hypothetical protein
MVVFTVKSISLVILKVKSISDVNSHSCFAQGGSLIKRDQACGDIYSGKAQWCNTLNFSRYGILEWSIYWEIIT